MYAPVLVTAPTDTPVSLGALKAHVGAADFSTDDAMLQGFLDAAVSYLDGWSGILGRCLMPQTWRQDYGCFERCLKLPLFPVSQIVSVKYDDVDGGSQTISESFYSLHNDDAGAFVRFKTSYGFAPLNIERPALHVEYTAGYEDADSIPAALKNAIMMLAAHWYANREAAIVDARAAAIEVPFAVAALIAPFRRLNL